MLVTIASRLSTDNKNLRDITITAKVIFLTTTGTGTWTVPSDWNESANTIEAIGAGARCWRNFRPASAIFFCPFLSLRSYSWRNKLKVRYLDQLLLRRSRRLPRRANRQASASTQRAFSERLYASGHGEQLHQSR